jgi:hypothetical protein
VTTAQIDRLEEVHRDIVKTSVRTKILFRTAQNSDDVYDYNLAEENLASLRQEWVALIDRLRAEAPNGRTE